MNIALTAHDAKKELMVQFCIAYCGILSRHNLCATGMQKQALEPHDKNLLRLCDLNNIPVATNIATAEVLIHGLERGDLDWREIVKL